jgi:hypothetical protein
MVRWMGLGVSIIAIASCGTDEKPSIEAPKPVLDAEEGMKSGTRLKLRWHDFDGSKAFAGLFDSQRAEECTPEIWADGQTYCTPKHEHPTVVYEDAACTKPLAKKPYPSGGPGCRGPENPYFSMKMPGTVCSSTVVSLHRGVPSPATRYYELRGTRCFASNGSPELLYDLADEITPAELIQLVPEPRSETERLQLAYGASADGARVLLSIHDRELDGACELFPTNDRQSLQCLLRFGLANLASDAACREPIFEEYSLCAPREYALVSSNTCDRERTLHRTGSVYTGPRYYPSSTACTLVDPSTGPSNTTYYELSPPLSIGELTRTPLESTDRRIASVRYSDSAIRMQTSTLRDRELNVDCEPTKMTDGTVRCLPHDLPSIGWFYKDAACRLPITLAVEARGCDDRPPPPPLADQRGYSDCTYTHAFYMLGQRYKEPLYRGSPPFCEHVPNDELLFYEVGPPVPLDLLAPATLVTEP